MQIGEKIRTKRKEAGLSQQELAAQVGVSDVALSYFERGYKTPSLATAKRLAQALNVSLDYLSGLSEES